MLWLLRTHDGPSTTTAGTAVQNRVVTPKIAAASAVRGGDLIPSAPPRRDKFEQEMLYVERMAVGLSPVLLKREGIVGLNSLARSICMSLPFFKET